MYIKIESVPQLLEFHALSDHVYVCDINYREIGCQCEGRFMK